MKDGLHQLDYRCVCLKIIFMKSNEIFRLLVPIMLIIGGFYARNSNTKLAQDSPAIYKRWYILVILGVLLLLFRIRIYL